MISMISEARARFLFDVGIEDMKDVHTSIIVTDLASTYRAEAYARDQLCFEVGIMDFTSMAATSSSASRGRQMARLSRWRSRVSCSSITTRKRSCRCRRRSAGSFLTSTPSTDISGSLRWGSSAIRVMPRRSPTLGWIAPDGERHAYVFGPSVVLCNASLCRHHRQANREAYTGLERAGRHPLSYSVGDE